MYEISTDLDNVPKKEFCARCGELATEGVCICGFINNELENEDDYNQGLLCVSEDQEGGQVDFFYSD